MRVIPRDGLRVRFHVVRDAQRLHMVLDHDGFAKEQPIVVSDDLSRVQFVLENRTGRAHETGLTLAGLPAGQYNVSVDGKNVMMIEGSIVDQLITLPVSGSSVQIAIVRR